MKKWKKIFLVAYILQSKKFLSRFIIINSKYQHLQTKILQNIGLFMKISKMILWKNEKPFLIFNNQKNFYQDF